MPGRFQPPKGKRPVFIGAGNSPCVRHTERSLASMMAEAVTNAIADAGLRPEQIDGFCMDPSQPDSSVPRPLGLDIVSLPLLMKLVGSPSVRWYAHNGVHGIVGSVIEAANALAAGACEYAVVAKGARLLNVRYHKITNTRAGGEEEFVLPYGAGNIPPQYHSRYLAKYSADREAMADIILNANRNAQDTEHAVWRGKVFTREHYLDSRFITYPLCLLDYDMAVNGAGAVVMTTEERAKDTPHPGGAIAGYAMTNTSLDLTADHHNHLEEAYLRQRLMAAALWESAGVGVADIGLLQINDGFSPTVWPWLEMLGFCGEGEAWQWATLDRISRTGSHPLNTSGGSLGEGRLHGVAQVCETARQMMGTAGPRQLDNLNAALCQGGSISNGVAFVALRT